MDGRIAITHIRDFAKIYKYSNAIIIVVCVKATIKHVLAWKIKHTN